MLTLDGWFNFHAKIFALFFQKYNDALIMNDHVRSSDVKEYLENFLEDQPSNETNRALREIYDEHGSYSFFYVTSPII